MRHVSRILATLIFIPAVAGAAWAQSSPAELVRKAVAAQGGADALRAIKTLAIKGAGKQWVTGQSFQAEGEPRFVGESNYSVSADFANRTIRVDWDRELRLPVPSRGRFSEILFPDFGVVADGASMRPMSAIRVAVHQREFARSSPVLLLKALDSPQNVSAAADQRVGEQSWPAVNFVDGGTNYIIMFDRATGLPAAVRTRDDDHLFGDSDYDVILTDWKVVSGTKLAHALSFRINGVEVQRLMHREVVVNAAIAPGTFAVSDEVSRKARTAAARSVPFQWVIGRLMLGRFVDSDAIFYPSGGSFRLSELAPNVQQVVGGSANNLIVAMDDGIVVFDAPVNEEQSRWVIGAAKARYPGKPIKYLVLTHHHNDHSGGMRTYVVEGATIIVPSQSYAFFEKVVRVPRTVSPDSLHSQPRPAKIVAVKDSLLLNDAMTEINLYNIQNPHADGFLIGHVVKENIVWITDLVSPRPEMRRTLWSAAAGAALRKHNIENALIAGGHGTTGRQVDLANVLAAN